MDVYKVGVNIALANNVSTVLAIISRDLLGLKAKVGDIEKGFAAWRPAILGAVAVLGGVAMFDGLKKLATAGGEVNHQLELMKIAGMSNDDIQKSLAQSMKTSGNVMTTTLAENLAHIRELRFAFGETSTAMSHLDEISKANSILNAVKGGGNDQVWELVKALEGKGLTYKPEEFSSYVNTMTKVVEASGGKVTPQMFMSTFKYGRTATLGWDEAFVGGALPRLMQSMASGTSGGGGSGNGGPGNALMSAFAKVVQGQMPKTAAEEFERMGLGTAKPIKGSAESQIAGGIKGRDLFMSNPYEWVQTVLMPALSAHGITQQNDIIAQVSKMFPVRTASQIITEMGLQGRFHEGAQSPFEKDIGIQHGAMGQTGFDELIKNDYPTVLKAFNQQWKSLLETLGSSMLQPGGPVLTSMAALTTTLNNISQFAGAHPEGIKMALEAIGALMVGLTGLGLVALAAALAPLVGAGGLIAGLVAALGTLAAFNWDSLKNKLGIDKGGSYSSPGKTGMPAKPMSFNPGNGPVKAQPISLSLNVDGRTLAQAISDQMESLYGFPTGAPASNGVGRYNAGDHNYTDL